MNRKIAIVEDEPAIRENYKAILMQSGYSVDLYSTRAEALATFEGQLPDLAIIDIGLADEFEGGFDLCRQLRQLSSRLPIIFLTARDSEIDAVSGLRLGADDYLTKGISLPHLVARITALFRRLDSHNNNSETESIQCDDLYMDMNQFKAQWKHQALDLTLTEFWITYALAKRPGHVKNRQQLMDAANTVLDDNTITSHIKRIRKKFVGLDPDFNSIQAVYGAGYRWYSAD